MSLDNSFEMEFISKSMEKTTDSLESLVSKQATSVKSLQNSARSLETLVADVTDKITSAEGTAIKTIIRLELSCSVCFSLRKPVHACDICSNIICGVCLKKWHNKPCPTCRNKNDRDKLRHCPKFDRIIDILQTHGILQCASDEEDEDAAENSSSASPTGSIIL